MSTLARFRWIEWAQVGLLAALVLGGVSPVAAQSPLELFDELVPPELVLGHAAELGLSAEQRRAVERIQAEAHRPSPSLLARMRQEREALMALLRQEKPDEAAVAAQFDRLTEAETELKRVRLRTTIRTKRVLTAEQQGKALALQRSRAGEGSLAAKLQRVREGLEQWKREGRDVAPLRVLWDRFREAEARGFYRQARQALDEAVTLLDAPPPSRP
jgi:Spy/CpxP family protein refolding chaperone